MFEGNDVRGTIPVRVPDDWFVGFHQGLAARFWRAAGATMADADAQVVSRLLDLPPGSRVLDAPCGDGRVALRLAAAGHRVIGVDLAEEELALARRAAADAQVHAEFVAGDLRALPDVGRVDALVSWGNSFGYLVPAETARSLQSMHETLRPGGRLVLESGTVAESLLSAGIRPEHDYEFGGLRMRAVNSYRPQESRMESEYRFEDASGRVERSRGAHHVHTSGEVVRMLEAAGFGGIRLLAEDGVTPYAVGSSRLIAVATA